MNSTQNLDRILNDLHFSQSERAAFLQTTQAAREYMKDGSIDLEKRFREIVEKVAQDEIQED